MKKQIKKILKFILILFLLIFAPYVTFAQTGEVPVENAATGLSGVVSKISELFETILPVLVAFGVIYFIFGVIQYVIYDSEEAKKKGKDKIIYGIIGLAVIVSVWGLVAILNQTLGLGGTTGLSGDNAPDVSGLVSKPASTSSCPDLSKTGTKFSDVLDYGTCIIGKSVIPFIFALAMVMFIWGAVKFFIINADEEAKRAQGKQFMIWGIVALAVMISVWSLVKILGTTFGLETSVLPTVKP